VLFAAVMTAPGAARAAAAPHESISFASSDGAVVHADLYGDGWRAVVLAHGGRFDKGSWAAQATTLVAHGYRVIALDFRGYGESRGPGDADPLSAPLHLDVLAAVQYARALGAERVAVVGGSMGGTAAADAAAAAPGVIDRVVLLGARASVPPEQLTVRKLYLVTRDDVGPGDRPRLAAIQQQFERAPEPKQLIVLDGAAHAQYVFETDQGERAMREILRFLAAR
jgi:pimeloyl-ACP methyl ester carboxylesterase